METIVENDESRDIFQKGGGGGGLLRNSLVWKGDYYFVKRNYARLISGISFRQNFIFININPLTARRYQNFDKNEDEK